MHSIKYILSLLVGTMLILSSCSLLEKKPTPEKEQVDQEDTQDIQAKTTGENPTSPLP